MTDEENARLRAQAELSIWLATRPPERSLQFDMLSSASRCVVFHYAVEALNGLTLDTVIIRSGFAVGVLRPTG